MPTLVIPDPGLREYSGHHPATIKTLVGSDCLTSVNIDVYVHRDCRQAFIDDVSTRSLKVMPHFECEYYQYFYQSPSLYESQIYIKGLAKEYLDILHIYIKRAKTETILFWFHTLSWQHAYALALAMQYSKAEVLKRIKFLIGLMYSPVKKTMSGELDLRHQLNNELAFRFLAKQQNTHFFAADAQLQHCYTKLLKNKDVGIQPCTLINDTKNLPVLPKVINKVILFVGDAKPNKGFLKLPELVNFLLANAASTNIEFVVHCTLDTQREDLLNVHKLLKDLESKFTNFILIDKFLSHIDLQLLMHDAKAIVFNYDESIYKNQSSGVLWVAAYYGLSILSFTSTWVENEAQRLDCDYSKVNKENVLTTILEKCKPSKKNFDTITMKQNSYRNQLFLDIGKWLKDQF